MRRVRVRSVPFLLSLLVAAACGRLPDVSTPTLPAGGPVIVVANQDHGVATIVDLTEWRLVAHLDVGMNPHEAAASPDGTVVALASPSTWLGDARKIALIDPRGARLVRSIDLDSFRWPHGLAFLDPRTVVVSSRARSGIVFVDTEAGTLLASAEARGSEPYLLHVATATGRLYTSSPGTNTIAEYDLRSRTFLREIEIADGPAGFTVSPDGRTLWVSTGVDDENGTIVAVDVLSASTRARFPIPGHARRLTFTGDGTRVVATDVIDDSVFFFDAAKLQQLGRIALGDDIAPSGIVCEQARRTCYLSTIRSGELIEVDVDAMRVGRRLAIGSGGDGLVIVGR